jgi:hypothetical protein
MSGQRERSHAPGSAGQAVHQAARDPQQVDLGVRELAEGVREPGVAVGHVGGERLQAGGREPQDAGAPVVFAARAGDEPVAFELAERAGERLRALALGVRDLSRRALPGVAQMGEDEDLVGAQRPRGTFGAKAAGETEGAATQIRNFVIA